MIINVDQEDIDKGSQCCTSYCPLALALKREFPGDTILVSYDRVWVGQENYKTTEEGKKYISTFDKFGIAEPGPVNLYDD